MRRINNADIKFPLAEVKGLTENFKFRFYTTNESFYLQKDQNDVYFEGLIPYLKLDWDNLQNIGKGVMNYTLYTYKTDSDFDDGVYDNSYSRTTNYYIDTTIVVDDDEDIETISQKVDELEAEKADKSEVYTKAQADNKFATVIDLADYATTSSVYNGLRQKQNKLVAGTGISIHDVTNEISCTIDLSNYYTKAEVDALLAQIKGYEVIATFEIETTQHPLSITFENGWETVEKVLVTRPDGTTFELTYSDLVEYDSIYEQDDPFYAYQFDQVGVHTFNYKLKQNVNEIDAALINSIPYCTSVTIPNNITSIDVMAFFGCNLSSVTIYATTPPTLGDLAFGYSSELTIYVPSASVDTYKAASDWSDYTSKIEPIQ